MIRTLRILAAISFVWIVGFFLLTETGIRGRLFAGPFAIYSFVSSLGGELGFAVGILALATTAMRRQFGWFALFALLLVLLNLLPLLVFQTSMGFPYPNFLSIFELPRGNGPLAWIVVLPALLPGSACVYTFIATYRHPIVAAPQH